MLWTVHEPNSIGDSFISAGALTQTQVEHVLMSQQQDPTRLFGEIAVQMGYLSESDLLAYLLSVPKKRLWPVGVAKHP